MLVRVLTYFVWFIASLPCLPLGCCCCVVEQVLEPLLQSFHESPSIMPFAADTETSTDSVVEPDSDFGGETVARHADAESNTESVQVSTEESREGQVVLEVDIFSPDAGEGDGDGNEGSAVHGGVAQQQQQQRQQEEEGEGEVQQSSCPVIWKEKEVRRAAWCLFEVLLPRCVGLEGQSLETRLQEPTSFSNRCGSCLMSSLIFLRVFASCVFILLFKRGCFST